MGQGTVIITAEKHDSINQTVNHRQRCVTVTVMCYSSQIPPATPRHSYHLYIGESKTRVTVRRHVPGDHHSHQ